MTENFFIMIRKLSMSFWRDRVEFARRYRLRQRLTLERLLRGFDREPRGDVLQPLETLAQVVLELPGISGAKLEVRLCSCAVSASPSSRASSSVRSSRTICTS